MVWLLLLYNNVVLTAGRPVPGDGQVKKRVEGVAIVLAGPAIRAGKAGGSGWKAWSSRLITATLITGRGSSRQRKMTYSSKHFLQFYQRELCDIGGFQCSGGFKISGGM